MKTTSVRVDDLLEAARAHTEQYPAHVLADLSRSMDPVFVSLVIRWHERMAATARELARKLDAGEGLPDEGAVEAEAEAMAYGMVIRDGDEAAVERAARDLSPELATEGCARLLLKKGNSRTDVARYMAEAARVEGELAVEMPRRTRP